MELSGVAKRKRFLDESRSASGFLAPIWVRRGHWVLLHGRYSAEGEWIIHIYDSLPTFTNGEADRVARSFFTNMHVEYRIESPQWHTQIHGSNDCVLFVLRAAAAITRNVSIEKVRDILPRHVLREMLLSVPLRTTEAVSRMSHAETSVLNEAVAKHIKEEFERTRSNLALPRLFVSGFRSISKWIKEKLSKTKPDGSETGQLQSLEQPLVGEKSSWEEGEEMRICRQTREVSGEPGPPGQHASPAPPTFSSSVPDDDIMEFMDYMNPFDLDHWDKL